MIDPLARDEFLRFLDKQRADYAHALATKLAEVEGLWRGIANGEGAPGDLDRLVRAAHGLAGSGAMFGFAELGAAAKGLELRLQRLAESRQGPKGEAAAVIEESIARLHSCAPGTG